MDYIAFTIKPNTKDRVPGRYNVSDLYFLFKEWTTIEDYLKGKSFTPKELWDMAVGTAKHEIIQKHFEDEYDIEPKKEYQSGDITIVGKADMIKKDKGLGFEIKTSTKLYEKSKEWHDYQARMYCSLFEIPRFLIVQPVIRGEHTLLKVIGKVDRNDSWFQKQVQKVVELNKKIQDAIPSR